MSEHTEDHHDSIGVRTVKNHQFTTMIVLVIIVAFFLVYTSLSLYQSSGTLQLDLSRPGYDSAREEATKDSDVIFRGYSADGPVSSRSLQEFDTLYKEKASQALIEGVADFSGDPLSDSTLVLDRD